MYLRGLFILSCLKVTRSSRIAREGLGSIEYLCDNLNAIQDVSGRSTRVLNLYYIIGFK